MMQMFVNEHNDKISSWQDWNQQGQQLQQI